jgi:hypothetical protein
MTQTFYAHMNKKNNKNKNKISGGGEIVVVFIWQF